jgi:hypothetical protein
MIEEEETPSRAQGILHSLAQDKGYAGYVARIAEILRNGDPWYLYRPFFPILAAKYGWRGVAPIPNIIASNNEYSIVKMRKECTIREFNDMRYEGIMDDRYKMVMVGVLSIAGHFRSLKLDGEDVREGYRCPTTVTNFDPVPFHMPELECERFRSPLYHERSNAKINIIHRRIHEMGLTFDRPFLSNAQYSTIEIEGDDDVRIVITGFNVVAHIDAPVLASWVFSS